MKPWFGIRKHLLGILYNKNFTTSKKFNIFFLQRKMLLKNNYYYFKNAIPHKLCDEIIATAKNKIDHTGLVSNMAEKIITKKTMKDLNKMRKSNIVWLDETWIYKETQPFIHLANQQAGWNFDWDWTEPCQFTKYKKGQFYGWHSDSSFPNKNNRIRKLSVSILLSNPKDFKGGELEFNFVGSKTKKCKELNSKGSMVIFPSFMKHRVKPVIQGERNSLVMWNTGRAFR